MMNGLMPVMALEGEVSGGDFQTVLNALTGAITTGGVATVLAACVTACAGIALLYWGARKGIRMFMGALNRGKIKL